MARVALFGVVLACLNGCPGDDDPAVGSTANETNTKQACGAYVKWEKKCEGDAARTGKLWGESECPTTIPWHYVRSEYIDALVDCFDTLSCERSDDSCSSAAFEAIGVTEASAKNDEIFTYCRDRVASCSGRVNDDLCTVVLPLVAAGRTAAERCFEQECDAIAACIGAL